METTKDTILIADDFLPTVQILFDLLDESGFKVFVAKDGQQAIQRAQAMQPDLILLDVLMPDIDGFEVCRILKSQPQTRDIPIIFITALTDLFDKVTGFKAGAADYITKPFQAEEILARIRTHLSLYKLQRQLLAQTEQLSIQNQQLQKLTEELQQQASELEKRNTELDTFAHAVAYDLKNPLNAIINLTGGFLDQYSPVLASKSKEMKMEIESTWLTRLKMVETAGQRAVSTLNALLVLANVSRQPTVTFKRLDMSVIVQKVKQDLQEMIEQTQGQIIIHDHWPKVWGYAPWVEEIWINYLSNGLKYGGRPPQLELGYQKNPESDDGMVRFWVRDHGPGLTAHEQSQLFAPFVRLHKKLAEGHGLGLSIVRNIVERLGGEVGVESTPGQGSLFYFTLPANAPEED